MASPFEHDIVKSLPEHVQRLSEVAAKYSIRAATIGGAALILFDVLSGPHPSAFLIAGSILLGSAVIATAIKRRPF